MRLEDLQRLPLAEQREALKLLQELDQVEQIEQARLTMRDYTKLVWPDFIEGRHHRIMDAAFDRVISGECKRLIINLGPRHTKSEKASFLLPSKYFGHYPNRKIIQASHTKELAQGFGRRVRNLVDSNKYQKIFTETKLVPDAKAAGKWSTTRGGEYFAIGVGGKLAGYGADLLIIDDPHSEQDYIAARNGDVTVFDKAYEWYTSGPRQRLQPGAAIVIVMTRWHMRDITGRIIKRMTGDDNIDDWEIIEFPALLPDSDRPVWPEFWSYEELAATRAELPPAQWNAQYLQNPTAEEGALVKREWWRIWDKPEPPECEFIIQSWDTAFLKTETADYSACTTWGVFYLPDDDGMSKPNIILLHAYHERLEFPDLKKKAKQLYDDRLPDAFIVEGKAAGMPLIFELRAMGIPVSEFTPTRGNDKTARVNAVTDLFASGAVWCPDTRWAEDVREEFAAFPLGDNDDYVDSSTQALLRYRKGGFIPLHSDEEDEPFYPERKEYY